MKNPIAYMSNRENTQYCRIVFNSVKCWVKNNEQLLLNILELNGRIVIKSRNMVMGEMMLNMLGNEPWTVYLEVNVFLYEFLNAREMVGNGSPETSEKVNCELSIEYCVLSIGY